MGWLLKLLRSSIGKKFMMSITGLFLITFLIVHLSGNFALFKSDGGASFNAYSKFMSTFFLITVMEVVLVFGFLYHVFDGVMLYFENKAARGNDYTKNDPSANSSFFSRTMIWSGSVVFIFLVVHLRSFFVPTRFGSEHDMYRLVAEAFMNPYYSVFYILGLILLGFHLSHGFQSAFQTFGINNKKYTPIIKFLSVLISIVIPAGFATMPIYFYFNPITF